MMKVLLLVAVLASACGGSVEAEQTPPDRVSPDELGGMVLRAEEAPEGTEYIPEASGELAVDDVWSSDCCPGPQEAFRDAGFVAAYGAYFEKPGHSGDPIDTRPGVEIMSSTAVLFATSTGAEAALDVWFDYYRSPVLDPVDGRGLGEEHIAVMGSPNAPAETLFLYLWRIDRLILTLRVSAGRGSVLLEQVRAWVDLMHRRATT